jgi:hypothetical protein
MPRSRCRQQEIDDLLAGGLVEIAGRLIRHEDRRIGRHRTRKRDALLFAAGKLRRIVMQLLAEPDTGSSRAARSVASRGLRVRAAPRHSPSAVMVGIR